ncbi:kinase-like protein [Coniophora puteana RWD-64-598 SS2]|uniref:Kinase-like protein n=1 Tax=Coniophora puteana (strain RWD-64-598) TaxID=741705 RepID=A0A5M3N2U0_CONPW|nr:kinase-like protein [Coniophora puteana RWD-64-598 SS2]EIW85693.1 kinase-like protein [Coniophora puteana RWD-64-598 SS2]
MDEGEEIAIKVIHKPLVVMNAGKNLDTAIKQLENEWTALQMVTEAASPFFAGLLYSFEDGENIYFVQRLYPASLARRLVDDHRVPVQQFQIQLWAAETLLAIEELHELGIVHRDIKLDNVLLSPNGHAALADFGLAYVSSSTTSLKDVVMTDGCGTFHYMAPEMIHPLRDGGHIEYSYKVDMYAFGILLLELSLRIPEGSRWIECVPPSIDGSSVSLNAAVELVDHHEARHLIAQLIHRDPSKRPSWDKVKCHPFFEGINWGDVEKRSIPNLCMPHLAPRGSPRRALEKFVTDHAGVGVPELYAQAKAVMPVTHNWDYESPPYLRVDRLHGTSCLRLGNGTCPYMRRQYAHHAAH